MTPKPIRTRFAPSPTGPLHIGGVRSALFSWMLARHGRSSGVGGQFVLRIEDTDQTRFVPGSLEMIMDALKWLGIDWDEGPDLGGPYGPYTQSQRLELYQKWANWLVENDKAYRAYDSKEELAAINEARRAQKLPPGYDRRHRALTPAQEQAFIDEGRQPVIRLKIPLDGSITGQDLIRGDVTFDNSTLQDIVLLKADGFPTYHLAHVIDDHFMAISHVTRANEWLPSLPVHLHIWRAFGWDVPHYAHLPVLLNPNGKGKLSKRHAGYSEDGKQVLVLAKEFMDAGYYGPAVVNFLANIGWNYGDEQEVFDIEDAIARFDITQVQAANSIYPIEKLDWINGIYMREHMSADELAAHLVKPLEAAGLTVDQDLLRQVAPVVQTRLKTFNDVVDMAGFFFRADFTPASAADLIQKKMDAEGSIRVLEAVIAKAEALPESDYVTATLYDAFSAMTEDLGLKRGQLFGIMRVALTGQTISTPTFETMEILGKAASVARFKMAVDVLKSSQ